LVRIENGGEGMAMKTRADFAEESAQQAVD